MIMYLIKIEKWLFYLSLFFIPFETRIIFTQWGKEFIEWNSASLYLTDFLLLAVIFLWLNRIFKKKSKIRIQKTEIALFAFLGISGLSLLKAQNFGLGIYQLIKLFEFGALFLYTKNNIGELFNIEKIFQIFVFGGIAQAAVAIGQFIRQKSFGLGFLDESPISPSISGVAKIVVGGVKLIRPYGLTPHPNVLATFLLIAIFCALALFTWRNRDYQWSAAVFYSLAIAFLTFALFITFSRSVIIVGLIAIFGWLGYLASSSKHKWFISNTIIIFAACCLLITVFLWPFLSSRFDVEAGLADQSFNLRVFYSKVALGFLRQNPLLGLGLGNFVWAFQDAYHLAEQWMYQPVHNIYLLIASETGIFGLAAFLIFIFLTIRAGIKNLLDSGNNKIIISCFLSFVFCCLIIGLFDHFFWTLQQGQLMLWMALGILASFGAKRLSQRSL